jgi:hypothetical protein
MTDIENTSTDTNENSTSNEVETQPSMADDAKSFAAEMESDLAKADEEGLRGSQNEEPKKSSKKAEKKTEQPAVSIESLKELARNGKFEEISSALGVDPKQFDVPAARFAAFRRKHTELKEHEAKLNTWAQQLQDHYAPLDGVAKLLNDGDYDEALRVITGGKLDGYAFAKLMAEQDTVSDPVARRELVRLRKQQEELHRETARINEEKRLHAERQVQHEEAQAFNNDCQSLSNLCKEDPELEAMSDDRNFIITVNKGIHAHVKKGGSIGNTREEKRAQVFAFAKAILLDLRERTARLHGIPPGKTSPAGAKAVDTVAQGLRPTIRRASPSPASNSEGESMSDTARRIARSWADD